MDGGGGQTAKDPSAWTPDLLFAYFERVISDADRRYEERFVAQEKAVVAALAAAKEAVATAERNAEKWRQNANEWRGSMDDREKKFVSQDVMTSWKDAVDRRLDDLRLSRAADTGKQEGGVATWGYLVGGVGLILTALSIVGALIALAN
jgi:hypothetical protein